MKSILFAVGVHVQISKNDSHSRYQLSFCPNRSKKEPLIIPSVVLPEICYLISSRLGHLVMRRFLAELAISNTQLELITVTDLQRINQILEQYADSE
jgi:hypothetical protein